MQNDQNKIDDEERIRTIFTQIDRNKDDVLTVNEIKKYLKQTRLPHDELHVKELFDALDANHDGSVSYSEFHSYVINKHKQLYQLFREFDVNDDGKVDAYEIRAMLEKLKLTYDESDVKRLMKRMDKDQNGYIEYDEWIQLLTMIPSVTMEILLDYWREAAIDVEGLIPPPRVTDTRSVLVYLASGAVSAAASRTGTAPFERLKMYVLSDCRFVTY
jgi:solute carrier family 25 phosphate transporter 23/24/25/41